MAVNVILQTVYFIISYIGLVGGLFFFLNWISKGWLMVFIRVKGSRGKKVLTRVVAKTDTYFKAGAFVDKVFLYKTRGGKTKRLVTDEEHIDIENTAGIFSVTVDEDKDIFYSRTGEAKPGADANQIDAYIERIIKSPQPQDKTMMVIIGLLILVALLGVTAVFFGYDISTQLSDLKITGIIS